MNRVVVGDREYAVKFVPARGKHTTTHCRILSGPVGSLDRDKELVSEGVSRKFSKDSPNTVVGRTYALLSALTHFDDVTANAIDEGVNIRRQLCS